jgi:hypothetical protein
MQETNKKHSSMFSYVYGMYVLMCAYNKYEIMKEMCILQRVVCCFCDWNALFSQKQLISYMLSEEVNICCAVFSLILFLLIQFQNLEDIFNATDTKESFTGKMDYLIRIGNLKICTVVYKMWDPWLLTTLRASTACYGNGSFTITFSSWRNAWKIHIFFS